MHRPALQRILRTAAAGLTVVIGFIVSLPAFAEGDRHELRFRFQKGDSTHYCIRQDLKTVVEFNEVLEEVSCSANSIRHFKVLDVDAEGNATLELMIDRCFMSSTQHGATTTYDSTSLEETPPEHLAVAAMIGRPSVQIKVSPLGIVLGITPLLGQANEKIDVANQKLDVLFALPKDSLAVGDSWKESFTTEVQVAGGAGLKKNVSMQRRYKLTKIEAGIATIEAKTVVMSPNIPADEEAQFVQKLWEGEIRFDIAAGRMLGRAQKVDGQVANFSNGKGLLTVKSGKVDVYAPTDKLAAIDLKTVK